MKNQKTKGILFIVCFIILSVLASFVVLQGVGRQHKGKASHIKLGLDLAGGVSITYQIKDDNPTETEVNDTIAKIEDRVYEYSNEANVYKVGSNRIQVEIPGETDANKILEELGKPGSLSFKLEDGTEVCTGSDIKSAEADAQTDSTTGTKEYVVRLEFNDEGAKKFGDATTANVGKPIYIFYDEQLVSYPTVQEPITDGSCQIDGQESLEEAKKLATYIRIGALPLELEELSSQVVAAQLGSEAINTSVKAGAIGFGIVCLFMIIIYFWPGLMASLALFAYILLTMLALNGFNVTLTLPGMAGVILGVGMAVDANVIIFTRIKEELRDGKSVKTALNSGFNKALSAILDGNITTLIAAAVLYLKGSGTIRGFAETLALSIVLSMFTALVITKYLLNSFYALGVQKPSLYGKAKPTKVFGYVKISKFCMAVSLIVILAGLIALPINKKNTGSILEYDLDFKGGTSMTLTLKENMSVAEAEKTVKPVVAKAADISEASVQVQAVKSANQVIVKTSQLSVEQREAVQNALEEDKAIKLKNEIETENISATISSEMRRDAVIAVVIAVILMLIYIGFRFKDWKFGCSAVLALCHDVLVVFCLYSIGKMTVGSTFIACMLTIVGYSINATIIIFDRIRENLRTMSIAKDGLDTIVDTSISQTFTRTINTSLTTFVMVFLLWLMGVNSLKEFAIVLMTGIVCGGYSSVCVTGPLWYLFKKSGVKKAEAAAQAKLERQAAAKAKLKEEKAAKAAQQAKSAQSKPSNSSNANANTTRKSTPKKKGGKKKKK
ncbi:MAG: protein translocase subunit SecD [Lachnospiraceae bacterium]|nr:protein translocase subunit SecD [Lachnospiraceae bacterium]